MRRAWLCFLVLCAAYAAVAGCGPAPQTETPANAELTKHSEEPKRSAPRYDLARDEERGGHTLDRHVGRTDDELRERLERERHISAASTWTDRDTAESVVAEALAAESGRIKNWTRRSYPRANLALHYDGGRAIGRSLRRDQDRAVGCTSAVIVLRADGPNSFYVLTAYPEARE
jgi:Bacterial CdiA-CT RNAse A domain